MASAAATADAQAPRHSRLQRHTPQSNYKLHKKRLPKSGPLRFPSYPRIHPSKELLPRSNSKILILRIVAAPVVNLPAHPSTYANRAALLADSAVVWDGTSHS